MRFLSALLLALVVAGLAGAANPPSYYQARGTTPTATPTCWGWQRPYPDPRIDPVQLQLLLALQNGQRDILIGLGRLENRIGAYPSPSPYPYQPPFGQGGAPYGPGIDPGGVAPPNCPSCPQPYGPYGAPRAPRGYGMDGGQQLEFRWRNQDDFGPAGTRMLRGGVSSAPPARAPQVYSVK